MLGSGVEVVVGSGATVVVTTAGAEVVVGSGVDVGVTTAASVVDVDDDVEVDDLDLLKVLRPGKFHHWTLVVEVEAVVEVAAGAST